MIDLSKPVFHNNKWKEIQDTPHFEACHSTDARICAELVARMELEPGAKVMVPCTGYGEYLYALNAVQASITSCEIDDHAFDSQPMIGRRMNWDYLMLTDRFNDAVVVNPPFAGKRVDGKRPYVKIVEKIMKSVKPGGKMLLHLHPARDKGKDLVALHQEINEWFDLVDDYHFFTEEYPVVDAAIYRRKDVYFES